jgi:multiple sugar transport system substrate-binding protein
MKGTTHHLILKRILIVATVLAMLQGCFLGAMAEEEKVNLRVMVWGQSNNISAFTNTIYEVNPEFSERVNVEFIVGGTGDPEVAEQYRLALASGVPCADIIQLNYTQLAEFAEAGAVMDLSGLVEPVWDDLLDAAKTICTYKDEVVAVPGAINTKLFYYRTDIFEECGVDPATWETVEDMIRDGQEIQKKYPNYYIHNISKEAGVQNYDIYMMFTAFDGRLADEEGNYIADTDPGVRKAFETLKKLYDSGIAYDATDFTSGWEHGLASGEIVGELTSNWFRYFASVYAPDQVGKWAAAEWPTEIRKGSEAGGSILVIPTFCEHVDEAMEFLKYYRLDADTVTAGFFNNNAVPVLAPVFETITERAEHSFLTNNLQGKTYWQVEYDTFNNGQYAIFPYTPKAAAEMNIVNAYSTKYFSGEMDLDAMLSSMNQDLVMQIGNPYE